MFEAMAMALPIIRVSPPGEASRILREEDAGVWVPAGDPEGLVRAVQLLGRDPKARARYAKNSLKAAAKYTREKQARRTLSVLESVVGGIGSLPQQLL